MWKSHAALLLILSALAASAKSPICIPPIWCNALLDPQLPCCADSGGNNVLAAEMETCGLNYARPGMKIYGGTEAALGEYPWLVPIFYIRKTRPVCAGSVISRRWVLSAGHCVKGDILRVAGRPSFVRLGEHNFDTKIDCNARNECAPAAIDMTVIKFLAHPSYFPNDRNSYNDISLLQVESAIPFSPYIQPICLPGKDEKLKERTMMHVAGWGRTPEGLLSKIKLKTDVPLQSPAVCNHVFKNQSVVLSSGQLCAGGEAGIDTCSGDSGGPLMYAAEGGAFKIYGIVSFGTAKCGLKDFPAVYTKVSEYLAWISQTTAAAP